MIFFRFIWYVIAFLLAFVWGQSIASPLPQVHLTFHLAISDGKQAEVKASIINNTGSIVRRGYIVISAYDTQCNSTGDILQTFGELPVGKNSTVSIPLPTGSHGYHVTAIKTFDNYNFEIPTIDDTAAVLAARMGEIKSRCEQARASVKSS